LGSVNAAVLVGQRHCGGSIVGPISFRQILIHSPRPTEPLGKTMGFFLRRENRRRPGTGVTHIQSTFRQETPPKSLSA
jgi:hypothetical protein